MIGDGPERQNAEELARTLRIFKDIRFLGRQDQMDEILSISDLFLLPSQNESFGLSALEAMACGVPVISTNAGGLPEINIHDKTGFLSDVGDILNMSQHAIHILSDDSTLGSFKNAAALHARSFDKSRLVPIYEQLYETVIDAYNEGRADRKPRVKVAPEPETPQEELN
jgi:N-acetyl-alpha-D-glucosaminyl L-malate synthase BshA